MSTWASKTARHPPLRPQSGVAGTRALYIFLFVYVLISLTYQLAGSVSLIVGYFDLRHQVRAPFDIGFDRPVLRGLSEQAKRAGLVEGDTVESLDGIPYQGRSLSQRRSYRVSEWR